MAENIRIPTREEAGEWMGDLSERSGKVFEQVRQKIARRQEKRTLGTFLKNNAGLPLVLGVVVLVGIIVVARFSQSNLFSVEVELDEEDF